MCLTAIAFVYHYWSFGNYNQGIVLKCTITKKSREIIVKLLSDGMLLLLQN
jgi:hypothetical protein